jgi:hypothetical protein
MKLNPMQEIVPPIAVTAVNILTGKQTTPVFGTVSWQQMGNYVMAGGGLLAYEMGWGGRDANEMLKNLGIAAAPLALLHIYNKFAGSPTVISRGSRPIAMNRVSRYPAPANESPFQGVRLV